MTIKEQDSYDTIRQDVEALQESITDWGKWARSLVVGAVIGIISIAGTLGVAIYKLEQAEDAIEKHEALLAAPRFSREDYEREEKARATYIDFYLQSILEKINRIDKILSDQE